MSNVARHTIQLLLLLLRIVAVVSVAPCDDFYEFACGKYAAENPIPDDSSSYTVYTEVNANVGQDLFDDMMKLQQTLTEAPKSLKKLSFLFQQCLDGDTLEKQGGKPLIDLLFNPNNMIGSWPAINPNWNATEAVGFEQLLGATKKLYGVDSLVATLVYADDSNSSLSILNIQNALLGLGLYSYKYFLSSDPHFVDIREAYKNFMNATAVLLASEITETLVQVNFSDFEAILEFEVMVANLTSKYDFSDGQKLNLTYLSHLVPDFNWDLYLKNLLPMETYTWALSKTDLSFAVLSTSYLNAMIELLRSTDRRTVQNYVVWRLVKYFVPYLSGAYRQAEADFNAVFKGSGTVTSRQTYCTSLIRGSYELPDLGIASGRVFVDNHFGPQDKREVTNLAQSILDSFQLLITKADWMDDSTKSAALAKAKAVYLNIGYPDWILNNTLLDNYYSDLDIPDLPYNSSLNHSFLESNQKLRNWAVETNCKGLQTSFDRRSFGGSPAATNSWYDNEKNALSLPAGEAQPPFYLKSHSKALNYGALGSVVGHEMQHGFDLTGQGYDADGNLNNWWSDETSNAFSVRAKCFSDQFNHYCYPASIFDTRKEGETQYCINGYNTANENMADLVGLRAAFIAYKQQPRRFNRGFNVNSSLTEDQQFFVSFASFFCGNIRPQALFQQLITNPHTPDRYRVIGTVRNLPEFAKAFNCPPGSNMTLPPEQTCSIFDDPFSTDSTSTQPSSTDLSTSSSAQSYIAHIRFNLLAKILLGMHICHLLRLRAFY